MPNLSQSRSYPCTPGDVVPVVCRGCRTVLGYSTGAKLVAGPVVHYVVVTLHCAGCDERRVWRPEVKREEVKA